MAKARKQNPAITGLIWHRDQYYSFFFPTYWHPFAWADDRTGVIYGPDRADPHTIFAVGVQDLGTTLSPADLDTLAEGFFEHIDRLPGVDVTDQAQKTAGALLELEAKYTFCEAGETRQRWVRVFYDESRQIVMTAQGASPEKYDYWLPMFHECMMTAKIHNQEPQLEPQMFVR